MTSGRRADTYEIALHGSILHMAPGSLRGLHLVVGDITAARAALMERGVDVGAVEDHDRDVKYAAFSDPDGNTWTLQEMP